MEGSRARPGSQGPSCSQPGAGWPGGTRAAPAPGIRHLCGDGDGDGLRPGCDMGPRVGLAWWDSWPGRAGLRRAGEQPCCSIAGAEADGPGG